MPPAAAPPGEGAAPLLSRFKNEGPNQRGQVGSKKATCLNVKGPLKKWTWSLLLAQNFWGTQKASQKHVFCVQLALLPVCGWGRREVTRPLQQAAGSKPESGSKAKTRSPPWMRGIRCSSAAGNGHCLCGRACQASG